MTSPPLARGVAREKNLLDGAANARTRYLKRYLPGQQLCFNEVRPLDKADIVIDNNNLEAHFFIKLEKLEK